MWRTKHMPLSRSTSMRSIFSTRFSSSYSADAAMGSMSSFRLSYSLKEYVENTWQTQNWDRMKREVMRNIHHEFVGELSIVCTKFLIKMIPTSTGVFVSHLPNTLWALTFKVTTCHCNPLRTISHLRRYKASIGWKLSVTVDVSILWILSGLHVLFANWFCRDIMSWNCRTRFNFPARNWITWLRSFAHASTYINFICTSLLDINNKHIYTTKQKRPNLGCHCIQLSIKPKYVTCSSQSS